MFQSKCNHSWPKKLCDVAGIEIYLGSYYSIEYWCEQYSCVDLVLNLTGNSHKPMLNSDLDKFQLYQFEELILNSPDGGYPAVTNEFWGAIIPYAHNKGIKRIFIHCAAGHGRTGVAAAAILIANGQSVIDSVGLIRNVYCKEAIETNGQVDYLGQLADFYGSKNDAYMLRGSMEPEILFSDFKLDLENDLEIELDQLKVDE